MVQLQLQASSHGREGQVNGTCYEPHVHVLSERPGIDHLRSMGIDNLDALALA